MTEEYIIKEGRLEEQEQIELERLGLDNFVSFASKRIYVKSRQPQGLGGSTIRHSFSLPLFDFSRIEAVFEGMSRLNHEGVKPDKKTTPRRKFGVYACPDYDVVLVSPAFSNDIHERDLSSPNISEYLNPIGVREFSRRHYQGKVLGAPVVQSLFIARVGQPKDLLLECVEKGTPFKFLHTLDREEAYKKLQYEAARVGLKHVRNEKNPTKDLYRFGRMENIKALAAGYPYFDNLKK